MILVSCRKIPETKSGIYEIYLLGAVYCTLVQVNIFSIIREADDENEAIAT